MLTCFTISYNYEQDSPEDFDNLSRFYFFLIAGLNQTMQVISPRYILENEVLFKWVLVFCLATLPKKEEEVDVDYNQTGKQLPKIYRQTLLFLR